MARGSRLPNQHNIERERHAYEQYFPRRDSALFEHIARDSSGNLLRLIADKLPLELVLHIAGLSWPCALQKPATIFWESQSLLEFSKRKKSNHSNVLKYAGEPVLVAYSNFLGYPYVTSLTLQENAIVKRQNDLSIAVMRDEVGVLDINFQGKFGYSRLGSWYKLIRAETGDLELCVRTKSIIVDVRLANVKAQFWNPFWDCQLLHPPKVPVWYVHGCETSPPQYMRYVELNNDIRGIVVGCNLAGFVSLETYGHSSKPEIYARTRDATPNHTAYVCFPLAKDEVVTAAWIRELDNSLNIRDPVLILSTSFQRTCTFGPYVPAERQRLYRYKPLVQQNACRITGFCYSDKGVLSSRQRRIGVTYEEKQVKPPPNPPFQAAHILPSSQIPQWFVSSGSIVGVIHVRLFVDTNEAHKPTVGMLLSYADHQESLGQYGSDYDVKDFELTGPMYFSSGETELGPYTKVVCNSEKGQGWREIPRTAQVLWWFTADCSQLDVRTA